MNLKQRVHAILQGSTRGGKAGRLFEVGMLALIALNILALVLETEQQIYTAAPGLFQSFEAVSVAIFTVEYLLRLWSATADPRYHRPVTGRLRFALTPLALVDLLAILPFYMPRVSLDLRVVRVIRLFRLFRVAKLGHYSKALSTFGRVAVAKRAELLTTFSILVVLLVLASSLMFYAENEAQPDRFSSILAAMWWGIATLTTIGYGDIYPITGAGKVLAAVVAVLGIGMFALPTGILGAALVEEIQNARRKPAHCPHCGKEISDPGLEIPPRR
jgi:voltage-gated potassium channel